MALLVAQAASFDTGLTVVLTAANSSDTISVPDDRTFLIVVNGDGASKTVTLSTPGTIYGQAIPDVPFVVPAGATKVIPLSPSRYNDPSTGLTTISYSATTSVTAAVVRT